MAMQPEKIIGNAVKRYLHARGWQVFKFHGSMYMSGWPDYVAFYPGGRVKWIETKTPTGRLSSSQIQHFSVMEKMGQQVYVITDVSQIKILGSDSNWRSYVRI